MDYTFRDNILELVMLLNARMDYAFNYAFIQELIMLQNHRIYSHL